MKKGISREFVSGAMFCGGGSTNIPRRDFCGKFGMFQKRGHRKKSKRFWGAEKFIRDVRRVVLHISHSGIAQRVFISVPEAPFYVLPLMEKQMVVWGLLHVLSGPSLVV